MSKARIFLILGIGVTVLSYLGFPSSWKDILFTLSGLVLIYFSYTLHYENSKIKENSEKTFDSFRENNYFNEKNTKTTTKESEEN